MKTCNQCKKTISLSEFHKRQARCKICTKEYNREYAQTHRELKREIERRTSITPERKAQKKLASAQRYIENKAIIRAGNQAYYDNNKAKWTLYEANRRAHRLQATPAWSDSEFAEFAMQEIYELRDLRSKLTGVEHHVDHIIPLQHSLVCGLHHPNNLRVITAAENLSKNNDYSTGA